jgi:hypothetical protein
VAPSSVVHNGAGLRNISSSLTPTAEPNFIVQSDDVVRNAVPGDKRLLGSVHLTILAPVKGKGAIPKDGSLLPLQADGMERREKEEQVLKRESGYRLRHFIGERLHS